MMEIENGNKMLYLKAPKKQMTKFTSAIFKKKFPKWKINYLGVPKFRHITVPCLHIQLFSILALYVLIYIL